MASEGSEDVLQIAVVKSIGSSRIENAEGAAQVYSPVCQVAEIEVDMPCEFARGGQDEAVLIVTGTAVDNMPGPVGTVAEKARWCLSQMRLARGFPAFFPQVINEKGWLCRGSFGLVTSCGRKSGAQVIAHLHENRLIDIHVVNNVQWLEISDASERGGGRSSEVSSTSERLAGETPIM